MPRNILAKFGVVALGVSITLSTGLINRSAAHRLTDRQTHMERKHYLCLSVRSLGGANKPLRLQRCRSSARQINESRFRWNAIDWSILRQSRNWTCPVSTSARPLRFIFLWEIKNGVYSPEMAGNTWTSTLHLDEEKKRDQIRSDWVFSSHFIKQKEKWNKKNRDATVNVSQRRRWRQRRFGISLCTRYAFTVIDFTTFFLSK